MSAELRKFTAEMRMSDKLREELAQAIAKVAQNNGFNITDREIARDIGLYSSQGADLIPDRNSRCRYVPSLVPGLFCFGFR